MTRAWFISLGISLALTLAIELGFALLLKKRGRTLVFVLLANVLTNPAVVLAALLWRYWALPVYGLWVLLWEVLAVLTEGYVYRISREPFSRPYLFSLAANALSFSLGAIIQLIL